MRASRSRAKMVSMPSRGTIARTAHGRSGSADATRNPTGVRATAENGADARVDDVLVDPRMRY